MFRWAKTEHTNKVYSYRDVLASNSLKASRFTVSLERNLAQGEPHAVPVTVLPYTPASQTLLDR